MRAPRDESGLFERGVAILSFDTEQMWGHFDYLNDAQFGERYPGACEAHDHLLDRLCKANIGATWFLVGGLTLTGSRGPQDDRISWLPMEWKRSVPIGTEESRPLWYRRSFIDRLRNASPRQEIGLHGGLSHLIWTSPHTTRQVASRELAEGVQALQAAGITPRSFSHPRQQERFHDLLPGHGIRCYRERTPTLGFRLGATVPGKALRMLNEARWATPPVVWPRETLPGLWAIPASLFLYPIGNARTRFAPLRSRVARFRRGVEAAIRRRGIFHYCLHPDNLAEAPEGFSMFDEMLGFLVRKRESGELEISTIEALIDRAQSKARRRHS